MGSKKNILVQKIFLRLKKIYLKMPLDRDFKIRAKNIFYKLFGGVFKNTASYQQWAAVNARAGKRGKVKVNAAELKKFTFSGKIAIHLHLFYIDLLDEFVDYFKNMPYAFDLYISVMNQSEEELIRKKTADILNVGQVVVRQVKNRGRDVSPLVSVFGQELLKYDYFCHVHSKKSLFTGNEQMDWRKHLMNHLFGSEYLLKSIFYWFENGEKIGMIYPETYFGMPYWGHTWLQNAGARDELFQRIGLTYCQEEKYIDYPMGTMFWARTDALRQFFEAKIGVSEFPEEKGQTDGTIAHAFERCLVPVCRYNGYNTLIFDERTGEFVYNRGKKNFEQYFAKSFSGLKLEAEQYDIISFDIFDTLVCRPVVRPDDLFDLMELRLKDICGDIPFRKTRKDAEASCRRKNPSEDCNLDDIYREFGRISGLPETVCSSAKDIEVETELEFIFPRREMVEFYHYVRNSLKKKTVIITDMYLRRQDIDRILKKCGIEGYDELWLSSETNLRKDNGTLWDAYATQYKGKQCLHIGDNEVADIQLSGDRGIRNYHVMSARDLFECSNAGEVCSLSHIQTPADSVAAGLVLKDLLENPFVLNKTEFSLKIRDEEKFGYNILGPVVLGYMNHLCKCAVENGTGTILFFAREGYLLRELYEIMRQKVSGLDRIKGEYIFVSRRALSVAALKNEEDIGALLDIYYRGSFKNLLFSRFGITDDAAEDREIELPEKKDSTAKLLKAYHERIFRQAELERDAYLKYYGKVKDNAEGRIAVADIGYSGTIQYYLSKLTGDTYDGYYFATDAKKKPLALPGNTIEGFYIDNDGRQDYSSSYIHRYHLLLESILIAPTGQLVRVDSDGGFVYTEEKNQQFTPRVVKIQEGIRQYFVDFYGFCKEYALISDLDKTFMEGLVHSAVECSIADKNLEECFNVEDSYCSDCRINVLEHYRDVEYNR